MVPGLLGPNHSRELKHHRWTWSWTLQVGKNGQYEFLVSILTGLLCCQLHDPCSCVVQISWHQFPAIQVISQTRLAPSTSSLFIGIWPYTSTQSLLRILSHTSSTFNKISGMYAAGIKDAVVDQWSQQSLSTDWVGMSSILEFLVGCSYSRLTP